MADQLPHESTEEQRANYPKKIRIKSGYFLGNTRNPPGLSVVKICITDIHPIHKGRDMLLPVTHLDYLGSEKSHPVPTRVPKKFG
jgi:hypothetical protein